MCQPRTNLALLNTALLRNNGFFITKNKKLYCCFYFAPLAQCQFGAGSSPSINSLQVRSTNCFQQA